MVVSTDVPPCLCLWAAVLIPSTYFLLCVAPDLNKSHGPGMSVATAAFMALTIVMHMLTAFSDPGRLPRTARADPPFNSRTRRIRTADGSLFVLRWCLTCKIWKPPRTTHCSTCDCCVLAYDHHCPFLGNCIGVRNYIWFYAFLCNGMLLGVCVLVGVAMRPKIALTGPPDPNSALEALGVVAICAILLPALSLACYHAMLIATNRTTKQHLKRARAGRHQRPHDMSLYMLSMARSVPRDPLLEGVDGGVADGIVAESSDDSVDDEPDDWVLIADQHKCRPCLPPLFGATVRRNAQQAHTTQQPVCHVEMPV